MLTNTVLLAASGYGIGYIVTDSILLEAPRERLFKSLPRLLGDGLTCRACTTFWGVVISLALPDPILVLMAAYGLGVFAIEVSE